MSKLSIYPTLVAELPVFSVPDQDQFGPSPSPSPATTGRGHQPDWGIRSTESVLPVFCWLLQFTNLGGFSSHNRTISVVNIVKYIFCSSKANWERGIEGFFHHSIIHYLLSSKIVAKSSKIAEFTKKQKYISVTGLFPKSVCHR